MLCGVVRPTIRAKVGHSVFLQNKNLKSIPINQDFKRAETIDLSRNNIKNFEKLPNSYVTTELFVDNTKITSFKYAPSLPKLVRISLMNTPIASHEHLNVMALIAFNCAAYFINDKIVEDEDLLYMYRNSSTIRSYLRSGYILVSKDPIVVLNMKDGTLKDLGSANKTREIPLNEGQTVKDFMFWYVGTTYRDLPSIPTRKYVRSDESYVSSVTKSRQPTSRRLSPFVSMKTLSFDQFTNRSSVRRGSLPVEITSVISSISK